MKKYLFTVLLGLAFAASACQQNAANNTGSTNTANKAETKTTPEAAKTPEVALKPGEVPFEGFSNVKTTAKAGEYILVPLPNNLKELAAKPDETVIYYNKKLVAPGDVESDVEDGGKTVKIPNAYFIPIPKGQKAKVGDIVLTWWQSGGGMFRGYVVEASNPAEPTVRYLDMTPRGDKQDKLKPDSFVVLRDSFQPGMPVAVKNGEKLEQATIIRVEGDKILARVNRTLKVYNKADVKPIPLKPALKAGDSVKVSSFGTFADATVVSVDEKTGEIKFKKENSTETAVDYGSVIKN